MRQTLPIVTIGAIVLSIICALFGYRIYHRHQANAAQAPVVVLNSSSRFYGPPPQSVTDASVRPQADGSLELTWKGGEGCDAFLITRESAGQAKPQRLADIPADRVKYEIALPPGTAWNFDLWIQGHNDRFGYVAPKRVRPPPAPEAVTSPPR